MAVYRNDPDLNLLGKCSNEELQLLVSILTTDPRDGDTRWTESLTSTPEYRLLAPDHRRYWQLIAAEFQRYGANTLASLVRLGQGVTYREILVDVCDKLNVNYNQKSTTETIELALLMKVLEKSLDPAMPYELSHLNALWDTLRNTTVRDEDGDLVTDEPFLHFLTGTPLFHIW
ncbi:hypothetical protein NUKP88_47530 [Klebsiella variicola]|uniref:DUF3944 domain-containing protein n=1 Tax=Klebsiella variicola TaxID=244366 RepID=UPI0021814DF9|nr:DUF3944 domain-containing protein [Klebsiella variicola]GKN93346.1 hypothetical protein NUKP88_47530 [Klebsiella variicola]